MTGSVGRIESEIIIRRVQERKEKITLQYVKKKFDAIIDNIAGAQLVVRRIEPPKEMLLVGRSVQLFFKYQGEMWTILTRVVLDRGEQIELAVERPAYRDTLRAVRRIYNDSSIRILAASDDDLASSQYPHTTRVISKQKAEKYAAVLPSDTSELIRSYFTALKQQDVVVKVVMFRERPPAHLVEKIAAYLGHPLIVPYPDTESSDLPIPSSEMIVEAMQQLAPSASAHTLRDVDRIPNMDEREVQIITPILWSVYCVGYLFMATRTLEAAQYRACIQFMERYSYVLPLVLEANGYFTANDPKQIGRSLRLIDISVNGLRASYRATEKIYSSGENLRLTISVLAQESRQNILMSARVVRTDTHSRLHYVAVEFVNTDPAAQAILSDYLYQE